MRAILTLLVFAANLSADPRFLPLKEGNSWTYRQRGVLNDFTIRVGTQALIGGNVYYGFIGYATRTLWVRFGDDGELYYRDEEHDTDAPLTSFNPSTKDWAAPVRICEQHGQAQIERGLHSGPAGPFLSTLEIQYRILNCGDVGTTSEQYAENVGMVERTFTTIAGPRTFDLVSARIGSSTIQTTESGTFGVSLQRLTEALLATLEIRQIGGQSVNLHYLSSQEYDVIVRPADGTNVWQWSDGKVFLPVVRNESTIGRSWSVRVPLTDRAGAKLPAGKYQLEAWIASGYDKPQYAAVVAFEVPQTN